MQSIFSDTLTQASLLRFCEEIGMPQTVCGQLARLWREEDLSAYADAFAAQLSPDTAQGGVDALNQSVTGRADGWLRILCVQLAAALHNKKRIYDGPGIAHTVFIDTMKCFSRFVREHKESYGDYGFDRAFWAWRQINGRLFRLGALEFEMARLSKLGLSQRVPPVADDPESPILSVHIPSDADLSRAALDDSYDQAEAFFARFYPDFAYTVIGCASWLLSPGLSTLLPPTSGILRFQSDYRILLEHPDSDDATIWVFKRKYESLADLPENTSLQRRAKALMLGGGHVGSAAGILARQASPIS